LQRFLNRSGFAGLLPSGRKNAEAQGWRLRDQLQDSKRVKLDGLGSFKLGLSTDGVEDYDKFEPRKHVKDVHVIFTPETTVDANGTRSKTFLEGVTVTELPKNAVGVEPEPEP